MSESLFILFEEVDLASLAAKSETEWVYILMKQEDVVYVGRTVNIGQRLATHRFGTERRPAKDFDRALKIQVSSNDSAALEGALIRRFNPPLCSGAPADESRDVEMLTRFGVDFDQQSRDAFVARYRQIFIDGHRKSRVKNLARRRWLKVSTSRVVWRRTKKFLERIQRAS